MTDKQSNKHLVLKPKDPLTSSIDWLHTNHVSRSYVSISVSLSSLTSFTIETLVWCLYCAMNMDWEEASVQTGEEWVSQVILLWDVLNCIMYFVVLYCIFFFYLVHLFVYTFLDLWTKMLDCNTMTYMRYNRSYEVSQEVWLSFVPIGRDVGSIVSRNLLAYMLWYHWGH